MEPYPVGCLQLVLG